jgi:hypothetical protein
MRRVHLQGIILSVLLVLAIPLTGAARPSQHASFDGRWTVVIITDAGTCDRAYRYPVRIAGGRIFYDGDTGVVVSGGVDTRGRVSVQLHYGQSIAQGSGRLSGDNGEGSWSGASSSSRCSGRWEAERHS